VKQLGIAVPAVNARQGAGLWSGLSMVAQKKSRATQTIRSTRESYVLEVRLVFKLFITPTG
jgi:hypothetical protein